MPDNNLEIKVYGYADPKRVKDVLPRRTSPQFLEEEKGIGGGNFTIFKRDPKLLADPTILDSRNIVKAVRNGRAESAFLIQQRDDTIVSADEVAGKQITVAGEGLKSWFRDATLYPFGDLTSQSAEKRVFSWASPKGSWYKAADWKTPINCFKWELLPTTPYATGNTPWRYVPAYWPDAPNAYWIWSARSGIDQSVPLGYNYFRYEFDTTEAGAYSVFAAGDNTLEVYMDAAQIIDSADSVLSYTSTFRADVELNPGHHILAFRVKNTSHQAGLLAALFRVGDAQAGIPAQLISTTGNSGWVVNAYPVTEPGWTTGEMLLTILQEADDRGVEFPNYLTPTFTATADSAGKPWDINLPWEFEIGAEYYDIIEQLEEFACDVWIDPEDYKLYVWNKRGTDRSIQTTATQPIIFREGLNLTKASEQGQADIKNLLLMKTGDGWVESSAQSPDSLAKYGRLEGSLDTDAGLGVAQELAQRTFKQKQESAEAATYSVVVSKGCVPFVDFNVGDDVLAPDKDGQLVKRRVVSLSLTEDSVSGVPSYAIEFDTIFKTRQQQLERWLKQATGGKLNGSSSLGGSSNVVGGATTGSEGAANGQPPAAPTNLSATSTGNWNAGGGAFSTVTLAWSRVLLNADGSLNKGITYYEISGRPSVDIGAPGTEPATRVLATVTGASTSATFRVQPAGVEWMFYVRAVTTSVLPSDLSAPLKHTPAMPAQKLGKPDTPTVTTALGTVSALWNGRIDNGETPPSYFSYVYAEYSTSEAGTYAPLGSTTDAAGSIILTGLDVGTLYWVRLVAVDLLGRKSDPSTAVSITVEGFNADDLAGEIREEIDQAKADAAAALSRADQAVTDASNANTAAGTAQTKADQAAADALAASGLAAGKGKVIFQNSAPTGDNANANNLWVNTTNGANTPNRWNGSAWVPATDKAATDAAALAAAAQTTANKAATDAAAAATAAGQAQTSADSKNRIWYQTTAPAGSAHKVGDTWFKTDDGNKIYRWDGSAWTVNLLGSSSIGPGAIAAGNIAQAVNDKIAQGISDAANANTNAGAANANATAAQKAASDAAKAALDAAGIASGKGKVWFQDEPPAKGKAYSWLTTANDSVSVEQTNGVETRRNLATDPRATVNGIGTFKRGFQHRWFGGGKNNGTVFVRTGRSDGPTPELTSYIEKTWTVVDNGGSSNLFDVAFSHMNGGNGGMPVTPGETYTLSSYFWSNTDVTYNAGGGVRRMTVAFYDNSGALLNNVFGPNIPTFSANTWVRLSNTVLVPNEAVYMAAWQEIYMTGAVGTQVKATGLLIEKSASLQTYLDGSFSDERAFDLWVDTNDGNKTYRWNSTTHDWAVYDDKRVTDAAAAAAAAKAVADLKSRNWPTSTTAPASGMAANDTWIRSTDGTLFRYSGSVWVAVPLATQSYVQSRGLNLITNGSGLLGDNTNFEVYQFDASDHPVGAAGMFTSSATQTSGFASELIPVDPALTYEMSAAIKQLSGQANFYFAIAPQDADGNAVLPQMYTFLAGSITTLAQPLAPGDTTITLTSSAGWHTGSTASQKYAAIGGYTDGKGYAWPAGVYTRTFPTFSSISGNVVTLSAAYTGRAAPAGTPVWNSFAGGTYLYPVGNTAAPTDWTNFSGRVGGITPAGSASTNTLPRPTSFVKLGFLANYPPQTAPVKQGFANIALNEITVAAAAQTAANFAQASANGKNTVTYGTAAPTVAGIRTGDIYFLRVAATGIITAQYEWTGTVWQARTLDNAVIANLDAGKLTAGTISAARIGTKSLTASEVLVDGSITALQIAANTLTAAQIKAGTITAAEIATGTITAQSGIIASLDAGVITSGFISSSRIQALSITTDKLLVGSSTNVFTGGDLEGTIPFTGASTGRVSVDTTYSHSGARSLQIVQGTGAQTVAGTGSFPVVDGDTLIFGFWGFAPAIYDAPSTNRFEIRDQNGALIRDFTFGSSVLTPNEWTQVGPTFPITVPTGVTSVSVSINVTSAATAGTVWLDDITLVVSKKGALVVDGTLLVDGTISSTKLVSNSITADQIKANSITAGEIRAGTITANEIATGTITATLLAANSITTEKLAADAITAKHTITGALLRTSATGARTEMTSQGIRTLDAAGNELVKLGYGITTGMSLRDPRSGMAVPMAAFNFGAASITKNEDIFIPFPPGGTNNEFGAYTNEYLSTYVSSPTGKIMVFCNARVNNQTTQQNYTVEFIADLRLNRTDPSAYIRVSSVTNIGVAPVGNFAVVNVTPNTQYELFFAFRAAYTFGGSGSPQAKISNRTFIALPI